MTDPYQTLGVSRHASAAEIKNAYRKLAKKYHPDTNNSDHQAAESFKSVSAAYAILGDPKTRARYDSGEIDANGTERAFAHGFARAGAGARGARRSPFGGFQTDDFFADIFGNFSRSAETRKTAKKGEDKKFQITVDFLEAALGATKRLTLDANKTLDVKIPAGVREGQQIRLKNQGHPGTGGSPRGDALVEIAIRPHPHFKRDGHNLTLDLPITLPEAVLGAPVNAPTLTGTVKLKIPAGASSGTVLRLKGKGIAPAKGPAGDLYVNLLIVLPSESDGDLQKLVSRWATKHDYKVRSNFS